MKVQLVVVRGKPEGKVIPLSGPNFKIGRGETCHLRPISEQISREHAEFTISGDAVTVRDLGSRNGTLVNGKALTAECRLKDRDLVQVGPLTFAVSISGAPSAKPAAPVAAPAAAVAATAPAAAAAGPARPASPDDVSGDEIDSWLLGEGSGASADNPTVYGGDTITITAFKDAKSAPEKPVPPPSASDDEYERQPEPAVDETADDLSAEAAEAAEEENIYDKLDDDGDEEGGSGDEDEEEEASSGGVEEEFLDESNPFYAAKKAQKEQAKAASAPSKASSKDSSEAANDILRRLMERRKASRE